MTFDEKKERALALMAEKKMWRSNYAPPISHLLWKCGVQIPPPPFAPISPSPGQSGITGLVPFFYNL